MLLTGRLTGLKEPPSLARVQDKRIAAMTKEKPHNQKPKPHSATKLGLDDALDDADKAGGHETPGELADDFNETAEQPDRVETPRKKRSKSPTAAAHNELSEKRLALWAERTALRRRLFSRCTWLGSKVEFDDLKPDNHQAFDEADLNLYRCGLPCGPPLLGSQLEVPLKILPWSALPVPVCSHLPSVIFCTSSLFGRLLLFPSSLS
jgi:hypothetical protein